MPVSIVEETDLIARYKATGDIAIRNQIILHYGNMIKYIALSMRNLYLKYAEVEDVVNECIISLIAAVDSFDIEKNVKFETYASIRIKGAVIDFIRKQDFIPRSVRSFSKELEQLYPKMYAELNREPTTQELAEKFGMPEDKFRKMLGESASATTLSFEELLYENNFEISDDESSNLWHAEKEIARQELSQKLTMAIDSLKEMERNVITLYYYEKLRFSDIAKVLQVSESRVCQIHSKAILKMRMNLADYLAG